MPRRRTKLLTTLTLLAVGVAAFTLTACVHRSGGTWMIDSAPLPAGWPELTPTDRVELRTYPVYRAAVVDQADAEGRGPMFRELFGHISGNDIAMTAPVDMGYAEEEGDGPLAMDRMAFLYRTTDIGATGADGVVIVEDVEPRTYASVGVRGGYTDDNYRAGLALVEAWLDGQTVYVRTGPARYLGYNGPFTLGFLKYAEVQVPVERVEGEAPAP